jgi:hypothetical protein
MRAEEIRTIRDSMTNAHVKEILATIANDYDRLERCAEDHEAHDSIMSRISADVGRLCRRGWE